jgi:hypothetical protein
MPDLQLLHQSHQIRSALGSTSSGFYLWAGRAIRGHLGQGPQVFPLVSVVRITSQHLHLPGLAHSVGHYLGQSGQLVGVSVCVLELVRREATERAVPPSRI